MVWQVTHPARGVAYRILHRAAVAGHSDFEPPAKAPRAAVVPRVWVAVLPGLVQRQGQGDHPLVVGGTDTSNGSRQAGQPCHPQ